MHARTRNLCVLGISSLAVLTAWGNELVPVRGGKQFFVDDYVIESKTNVVRELHQPVRYEKNPVLVGDQSWESWIVEAHGRPVVFDPQTKRWMMYYLS